MKKPHASWASAYDLVYEQSFGDLYDSLTDATLEKIKEHVHPPSSIVDFGAGTGRLSIPLAACGFEVVAVEPCEEMLDELAQKPGGAVVAIFIGKMEDFNADKPFDMAICVFTVLSYLLDESSLRKSIQAACNVLRVGGLLLIDIPQRVVFQNFQRNTQIMGREVTVTPSHDDLYIYEERTSVKRDRETISFNDSFQIRYWDTRFVLNILSEYDFLIEEDLSVEFVGTGSNYFLMKKRKKRD